MQPRIHTRLSRATLQQLLHYNQRTGVFTWRTDRGRTAKAGDIAGTVQPNGQRQITIDGKPYLANRLAWLYVTGELPKGRMTFVDDNPANNRWNNLMLEEERFSTRPHAVYQRDRRRRIRDLIDRGLLNPAPDVKNPLN